MSPRYPRRRTTQHRRTATRSSTGTRRASQDNPLHPAGAAPNGSTVEIPRVPRASSFKTVSFPATEEGEAALGEPASKSRDLMTAHSESADTRVRVETITDGKTTRILIQGEVDIANVNSLDAALTVIQFDGTRAVQIDASDLDFFDVAALRRLVVFAQWVKQTGRDVITCGATPILHDVARTLELRDDLGLH